MEFTTIVQRVFSYSIYYEIVDMIDFIEKALLKVKCKMNSVCTLYQLLQGDPFLWCTRKNLETTKILALAPVLQSLFNSHLWMCFMKGEDSQTALFSAKVMEQAGYFGYLQKFAQESGSQSAA